MTPTDFLVLALATAYSAHVISSTEGPFGIFARVRERLPLGGLTTCVYCLSPWCAAALWGVTLTPLAPLVTVLALAGGALMLTAWTGMRHL